MTRPTIVNAVASCLCSLRSLRAILGTLDQPQGIACDKYRNICVSQRGEKHCVEGRLERYGKH